MLCVKKYKNFDSIKIKETRRIHMRKDLQDAAGWQRAVVAFMILAIIVEVAILIWSVLSCFAFCYPSLFYPLPMLSALATIFLLVAVAMFGGKNSAEVRKFSILIGTKVTFPPNN